MKRMMGVLLALGVLFATTPMFGDEGKDTTKKSKAHKAKHKKNSKKTSDMKG